LPIGCERNTEDLTIFNLAFGNLGMWNTKVEHYSLHSDFQHSPFEETGFADERYSSFITTPRSLPRVDPPIVGPLSERYKSGVYLLRYFFKIHFCVILLCKHFFPRISLPFRYSGRILERISHIFLFLQALAKAIRMDALRRSSRISRKETIRNVNRR
jgi:hypothetical protein